MDLVVRAVANPRIRTLADALKLSPQAARAATRAADKVFREQGKELFSTEGQSGPDGGWQELSPPYKRWKDRLFSEGEAFVKEQARARGRKLTRRGVAKALGAENKILQLYGDLRRALTEDGDEHIAEAFQVGGRWVLRLGAQGKAYYKAHVEGNPPTPKRNPLARTADQRADIGAAVSEALAPFVVAAVRNQLAWVRRRLGGR